MQTYWKINLTVVHVASISPKIVTTCTAWIAVKRTNCRLLITILVSYLQHLSHTISIWGSSTLLFIFFLFFPSFFSPCGEREDGEWVRWLLLGSHIYIQYKFRKKRASYHSFCVLPGTASMIFQFNQQKTLNHGTRNI